MKMYKSIVLSSYTEENDLIIKDYCDGVKKNSEDFYYYDYIELYLALGKTKFEDYICDVLEKKNINIVIILWKAENLTFDLNFLKKVGKERNIVLGFFDTEYYFESVDRYYAQVADLVILPDYLAQFAYKMYGIKAICTYSLYDISRLRLCDTKREIEVSFVGNILKSNRKEYIDYLNKNGLIVETYGYGSKNGFIDSNKIIDVFNRSKIGLNFTGPDRMDSFKVKVSNMANRIHQVKGRPIEIALCGGFVLSEYAPGIEDMFVIGEEIDVFTNKEELLSKLTYYLNNHTEREKMANKAYLRAVRDYDAVKAFRKIFMILNEHVKKENKVYYDDEFIRNYVSYRFVYIPYFLFKGKMKQLMEEIVVVIKYRKINLNRTLKYIYLSLVYLLMKDKPKLQKKIITFVKKIKGISCKLSSGPRMKGKLS